MREKLIERMKLEIENNLRIFLREEGIELFVAANDNIAAGSDPLVMLEAIESIALGGHALLSEIRVILDILGKPWQCDALVDGIYDTLQPHRLTLSELTVLLMSLHVEVAYSPHPRKLRKRTVMRYIVEEI
jgi:hypothetical protein